MIVLLDNYDSFTYNLYQMLLELGQEVTVFRNDQVTVAQIEKLAPTGIVLSPGPGRPESAGIMMELIAATVTKIPYFGVCLGMQALGLHFGGKVVVAQQLMHGKTCTITHDGAGIFTGLQLELVVMRYHSLVLSGVPASELVSSAHSADGALMAFRHMSLAVEAVQFHPESFATEGGMTMMRNFLENHACR